MPEHGVVGDGDPLVAHLLEQLPALALLGRGERGLGVRVLGVRALLIVSLRARCRCGTVGGAGGAGSGTRRGLGVQGGLRWSAVVVLGGALGGTQQQAEGDLQAGGRGAARGVVRAVGQRGGRAERSDRSSCVGRA